MKKSCVIHPFLFALFNVLFLFSYNIEQVSFSEILLPLAIVLGFTFLLILLSKLVFRDSKKVGIIVSIAIVLFFSYGHIYNFIVDWYIGSFEIGRHRYLWLAWGLLFICSIYVTIKTRKDLIDLTNVLNIVAFSLILFTLFNIGVFELKTKNDQQGCNNSMEHLETAATDLGDINEFRDIYYIILDGYASSNTLKEVYNYDNQSFTDNLSKKGFYVATQSLSNYPTTFLSIASSLNMKYINYLTDDLGIGSKDFMVLYNMIKDNKVMNLLKLKGYKFIHFSSGWGPTDRNKNADLNFHFVIGNEFMNVLIQTTMLKTIETYIIIGGERKRRLDTFSALAKVYKIEGPKFVFAHILTPHPPYLFDSTGERVPGASACIGGTAVGSAWAEKEDYLNQLVFINNKVENLVDKLLLQSKVPPIIILQADHGSASSFWKPNSSRQERWGCPTENMLRERMRIFNAYYLPANGNDILYESITPINTFRLVFDFYFDTKYGLLDDQSYFSSYDYPYDFINVTKKVIYH